MLKLTDKQTLSKYQFSSMIFELYGSYRTGRFLNWQLFHMNHLCLSNTSFWIMLLFPISRHSSPTFQKNEELTTINIRKSYLCDLHCLQWAHRSTVLLWSIFHYARIIFVPRLLIYLWLRFWFYPQGKLS